MTAVLIRQSNPKHVSRYKTCHLIFVVVLLPTPLVSPLVVCSTRAQYAADSEARAQEEASR